MLYEHSEYNRQYTWGPVFAPPPPRKKALFSRARPRRLKWAMHHPTPGRTAERWRCQEANVVYHMASFEFVLLKSLLHIQTLKGEALATLNSLANESSGFTIVNLRWHFLGNKSDCNWCFLSWLAALLKRYNYMRCMWMRCIAISSAFYFCSQRQRRVTTGQALQRLLLSPR